MTAIAALPLHDAAASRRRTVVWALAAMVLASFITWFATMTAVRAAGIAVSGLTGSVNPATWITALPVAAAIALTISLPARRRILVVALVTTAWLVGLGVLTVHTATDLRGDRISGWTRWQLDAAGVHVYRAQITWREGTPLPAAVYLVSEHDRLLRVRQISSDGSTPTSEVSLDRVAFMILNPLP